MKTVQLMLLVVNRNAYNITHQTMYNRKQSEPISRTNGAPSLYIYIYVFIQ